MTAHSDQPTTQPAEDGAGANMDEADTSLAAARAVEDATQDLCRATVARPMLAPSEVDVVLAHLAAAAAALPQAYAQLSEILDDAKSDQVLETDGMADTDDPTLAVDTARMHLDEARDAAVALHKLLDAAHAQTAHVISHASL
ncbi:hypothetical protein [Nocardioides marmoraquaticus]